MPRFSANAVGLKGIIDMATERQRELRAEINTLRQQMKIAREALETIAATTHTIGPDPIGALHGAGMNRAFSYTSDVARAALRLMEAEDDRP